MNATTNKIPQAGSLSLDALRLKFNNQCKDMYPGAELPGDCYIFDVVLGLDPRTIPRDQTITKKSYKTYIISSVDGTVLRKPDNHEAFVITRSWTTQQKQALKEWWDLLSPLVRGDED